MPTGRKKIQAKASDNGTNQISIGFRVAELTRRQARFIG
jgi:hypothetical protein